LRKSALIGFLGARLSALLGGFDSRLGRVLALEEEDLIAAVAGRQTSEARRFVAGFDAESSRRSLVEAGVGAACRHSEVYPAALLALADVPPVLYITGGEHRLHEISTVPSATIVGSRRASRYALEVAHDLGRGLAAAGVTVVSGLALGVDAAAHGGVLVGGGRPLAVLAGGVDVPYPKANGPLREQIKAQGILLSELPPGRRPLRWSFPARNRIMAALGRLIVVVEAAESSGSLITAEFAVQLGREVGAVPGHVTARQAAGANRLLREGAAVIRSPQDALDELLGVGAGGRLERSCDEAADRASLPRRERSRRERSRRERGRAGPPLEPGLSASDPGLAGSGEEPSLDAPLRLVLDLVESGEGVEAIGNASGLGPSRARAALGRLELMGLVARDGFASYVRTLGPRRSPPIIEDPVPSEASP
jgi:DNA processing protein